MLFLCFSQDRVLLLGLLWSAGSHVRRHVDGVLPDTRPSHPALAPRGIAHRHQPW